MQSLILDILASKRMVTTTMMIILLSLVTFLSALPASTSFSTTTQLSSSSSAPDNQSSSTSTTNSPPPTVASSTVSSVNTTEIFHGDDIHNTNNGGDGEFLMENDHGNTMASVTSRQITPPMTNIPPAPPAVSDKVVNTAVAIVLNTNARRVKKDLISVAQEILGVDFVYVTTTAEEAREAARKILQQNVSLVVPVGGDGTLSSMVNFLCQEQIRQSTQLLEVNSASGSGGGKNKKQHRGMTMEQAVRSLPYMGYIPFGTGNGVGCVVGCNVPTKRRRPIMSRIMTILRRLIGIRQERPQQQDLRQVLDILVQVGNKMKYTPTINESNNIPDSNNIPTTMVNGEAAASFTHDEGADDGDPLDLVHLVELPMMELTTGDQQEGRGDLCFFAGVGIDSLMLQDFKTIKAWSQRTRVLTSALSSVAGYAVALVTHTLPKCVSRNAHEVRVQISTRDPDTLWVDHRRGDVVQRVSLDKNNHHHHRFILRGRNSKYHRKHHNSNNEVLLYKGIAGIVAAGTSPFYGGGLRLFPFARMTTDKMHLRIGRIHPLVGFVNMQGIFSGSYRDTRESTYGCIDFLGDDFDVTILPSTDNNSNGKDAGYPLQHSGEAVGNCEHFRLRVVKEQIRFVTFLDKRIVLEEESSPSSSSSS